MTDNEIIKSLQYDREQYDKGYEDGFKRSIKEFSERLKEKAVWDDKGDTKIVYEYDIDTSTILTRLQKK